MCPVSTTRETARFDANARDAARQLLADDLVQA
jgi:hypothetical protein